MPTMQEVRAKFPQYNDMPDAQLAEALHKKFYSDIPPDEFAKKIGLAPPQQPVQEHAPQTQDSIGSTAMNFAAGVGRGAIGLVSLPAQIGDFLGNQAIKGIDYMSGVDPQKTQSNLDKLNAERSTQILNPSNLQQNIEGVTGQWIQPKTSRERYADTIGQFASTIPVGGPKGLLGKTAGALLGGAGSEAGGQLAESMDASPQVQVGARLLGGVAGALTPTGLRKAITPLPISPEMQAANQTLKSEGIGLTAGQQSGRTNLKYQEAVLGGGKTQSIMQQQGEQFTNAALKKVGTNEKFATPEVMDKTYKRIGQQFTDLSARNDIVADPKLAGDLTHDVVNYAGQVAPSMRNPFIDKTATDVLNLAKGGVIDGKVYKVLREKIGKFSRETGDNQAASAAKDLMHTLDDAMERSIATNNPADLGAWKGVRTDYRNFLVLEQAATGAGENAARGTISPSALRNATISKQGRRNYATGQGDFADLARAGEATMKPLPQSGTGPRLMAQMAPHAVGGLLGAGYGGSEGGSGGAMTGALAGAVSPYLLGRMLMSKPVQGYLKNQAIVPKNITPAKAKALLSLLGSQNQIINSDRR